MRRRSVELAAELRQFAGRSCAILAAVAVAASLGCQSFAPGDLTGLSASRKEKKILQQAEHDPFPSPEDVGLDKPRDKSNDAQ
jgi:hypothetical protein